MAEAFRLVACRQLMESHPGSLVISQQVEALEGAFPDQPAIAISFCRTLIETTCKTILVDRGRAYDNTWQASQLWSQTKECLALGQHTDGRADKRLHNAVEKIVSGFNSVFEGVITIRNDHGIASHGAEAYAPLIDIGYAEILARATDSIVGLLFKLHLNTLGGPAIGRLSYEDESLRDFNERIDAEFDSFVVLDTPLVASEALFRTDPKSYREGWVEFVTERNDARRRIIALLKAKP